MTGQHASFRLDKKASFSLQAVPIDFVQGGLNVVNGTSGAGKTTFPQGILGETYLKGGSGFSPTNATSQCETILGLVRAMNNLEVELQSFDRVQEYSQLEPEEKPEDGYRDVTIRYDLDGPDTLKNANLKFDGGKRVAIVGRTGSGKSTATVLFNGTVGSNLDPSRQAASSRLEQALESGADVASFKLERAGMARNAEEGAAEGGRTDLGDGEA
ncbi:hypothetical protein P8C59_001447 [Phyllachora maydis]|uniref:ABC transporter domain-containing protein n=1 Tax=Phyllachora maydis TaxID=1825666 RepID=A0AAD9HZF2_9PEZI|nr:hypothetical protein P8C59_001447 [Phyllachora maydis]